MNDIHISPETMDVCKIIVHAKFLIGKLPYFLIKNCLAWQISANWPVF